MKEYEYRVQESVLIKILGIAFIVIGIGVAGLGLLITVENGRYVCLIAGGIIAAIGGLFLLDFYRRGLYIIREGKEYIYKPFIGPSKHFFRSDVAKSEIRPVKFSPQDQCVVLYDYEGKKLAGVELNMVNADRFAQEIASPEDFDKFEKGETVSTLGDYFEENTAVDDSNGIVENKEERLKKIKVIKIVNYILGALLLGSSFVTIRTDFRVFSLVYIIGCLFTWLYGIVLRDYVVIEYNNKKKYEEEYASMGFPIFCAAIASLMGLSLFRNITYVDDVFSSVVVLIFSLAMVLIFIILPKKKPYKKYFYVLIFFMGLFSGLFLMDSVSYYTADVDRVEDIEIIDTEITHGSKGRRSYYLTINSDSLYNERVNVPKYIYDYAESPLKEDLVVVFATDILNQEFYTIELDY